MSDERMGDGHDQDERIVDERIGEPPAGPEPEPEEQGLEARLARLDAIVERLERDDLDLEGALALYEEGIGHVREAHGLLERTTLRVEKLAVETDGSVRVETDTGEE